MRLIDINIHITDSEFDSFRNLISIFDLRKGFDGVDINDDNNTNNKELFDKIDHYYQLLDGTWKNIT